MCYASVFEGQGFGRTAEGVWNQGAADCGRECFSDGAKGEYSEHGLCGCGRGGGVCEGGVVRSGTE